MTLTVGHWDAQQSIHFPGDVGRGGVTTGTWVGASPCILAPGLSSTPETRARVMVMPPRGTQCVGLIRTSPAGRLAGPRGAHLGLEWCWVPSERRGPHVRQVLSVPRPRACDGPLTPSSDPHEDAPRGSRRAAVSAENTTPLWDIKGVHGTPIRALDCGYFQKEPRGAE